MDVLNYNAARNFVCVCGFCVCVRARLRACARARECVHLRVRAHISVFVRVHV